MTNDTGGGQRVLVVLSPEQREAYAAEFERFRRLGIELRFEESPEVGLDIVKTSAPALVIVGMTVGMMEGLEFVAMLLRSQRDFAGKVVVLPDKGDPFPPVVHARVAATGKSTTESIDLVGLESLMLSALAASTRPGPPEAAKPAAPAQLLETPPPIAAANAGASPAQAPVPRLAPRPAASMRGPTQKAATPASSDKAPTHAPPDGAQASGATARASNADARPDRAHLLIPDWLSQTSTIPIARGDEPIRILPAIPPVPQGPSDVVTLPAPKGSSPAATVPAPHLDEFARTSEHLAIPGGAPDVQPAPSVASSHSRASDQSAAQTNAPVQGAPEAPAPIPALALPSWLPKQPRQRLVVAVSAGALLAIVAAAIAVATMSDPNPNAVPAGSVAPKNSHN